MALQKLSYMMVRQNASHHVQVEILQHGDVGKRPGRVPTQVRIVRVFKSTYGIKVGSEVSIEVKVCRDLASMAEDEGGWLMAGDYEAMRYAEVYLNNPQGSADIAGYGSEIYRIHSPSDSPVVPCPKPDEMAAERARYETAYANPEIEPSEDPPQNEEQEVDLNQEGVDVLAGKILEMD